MLIGAVGPEEFMEQRNSEPNFLKAGATVLHLSVLVSHFAINRNLPLIRTQSKALPVTWFRC